MNDRITIRPCNALLAALILCLCGTAQAAKPVIQPSPIDAKDLDTTAFTQWVDGSEKPIESKEGARGVLWTRQGVPTEGVHGVNFGDSKTTGPRHLRIGWTSPTPVGSVLVRAGGQLSALKPDAAYPGNVADESQWIPAQRIVSGKISQEEVGRAEYGVWVFPPHTVTRALRFTHTAAGADHAYAGYLGGASILSERMANIAPQAVAHASANDEDANRINNGNDDNTWKAWDNGKNGAQLAVSADRPEWVTLIWPREVPINRLAALFAGFGAADAHAYVGSAGNPLDAPETDWSTIKHFDHIENMYPLALPVFWLDLEKTVTTRALRLRLTQTTVEGGTHLKGRAVDGKRVWLGELVALQPLGDAELSTAIVPTEAVDNGHPPIPVRFSLKEEGLVTLVIEDSTGKRVRNLVSETPFTAGENVAWWDGLDDLGRDAEAARHGIYSTPGQFVQPGDYHMRGLVHKPLDLRLEFSVYNSGSPAWETNDTSGGWLTNHTPPMAAAFVPASKLPADKFPNGGPLGKGLVFIGSYVSEGGAGLAWVDLDGRKRGGRGWVGGNWTAAPYLATDGGNHSDADAYVYVAAAWSVDAETKTPNPHGEIRVTALTQKGDRPIVKYVFEPLPQAKVPGDGKWMGQIGGLAVHDGRAVVSMPGMGELLVVDAKAARVIGTVKLADAHGLTFDAAGNLLVLVGKQLCRYTLTTSATGAILSEPTTIIASGLDEPRAVIVDQTGRLYITDRGQSHQVKVFGADGKFLSAIGHPGKPAAGTYDPERMQNPAGLTLDADNHLWVTEADFQPKRVSVWSLDGKLLMAKYGPSEYGGGGTLDSQDKTRFYLHGMEFKLDWEKGTDQLARVFYRPDSAGAMMPDGHAANGLPEFPIYLNGHRYFTNCYNSNPTGGTSAAMIWLDREGLAVPVAAMGRAQSWSIFKGEPFKSVLPPGIDLEGDQSKNPLTFIWSDLNGDGHVQPNEVQFLKAASGGITVMSDLAFTASRVDDRAMRYAPLSITPAGVPVYAKLDEGQILAEGAQKPTSSGGDQALVTADGWSVLTVAPKPFAPQSVGGARDGKGIWSYPDVWPGLHASHESAAPDHPGELVGTTRLLGGFITPKNSDAGPLWAINGNQGNLFVFTADGLFVSQLFQDIRQGIPWSMPAAERGMSLNGVSLHDENFWPSMTQTADGNVYLVDGGRSTLVRVDGLDSIHRLPQTSLTVTADDLKNAQQFFAQRELARQKTNFQRTMKVALRGKPPMVDGNMDDWVGADWVTIDKRGVAAYFNSKSKPYDVSAAVCISGDRLFAAYRTGDEKLLLNSGQTPNAPFKTGGALDLMIGADSHAADKRTAAAQGDQRLLVTIINKKPHALLYRPVVPGTKESIPFAAPWHSISIDRVDDVTDQIQFAGVDGNYEFSIPLKTLGLDPSPGLTLRGDLGILRGNGVQTVQRVYWSNKATAIVSDVPSEAELLPHLWGKWRFVEEK